MPIRRGFFGGAVYIYVPTPPVVTISSVTNFNQNRATFNATVNPNGLTTSVKFQYSTNGSTFTDGATLTGLTGGSQSVYSNQTGLAVGTLYYVRAIATNADGTVTSSNATFTTWNLKTYLKSTEGAFSVSIPSITPTGLSAIAPTVTEILLYGGGGGFYRGGGGGGGYRLSSSHTSSVGGTQTISGTVGAGGTYGAFGSFLAGDGGNTTLTIGSTTWTAGGGKAGQTAGGAVGTGDNPAYQGGTGNGDGYTYISGYNQWTDASCGCATTDKFGNCTAYNTCNNPNSPIYAQDTERNAGGGGGGTDSAGGNHTYPDIGGNGGNGGGAYGLNGGAGGGGFGDASYGSNGTVVAGGVEVGRGGRLYAGASGNGMAGGVTFKYYGP